MAVETLAVVLDVSRWQRILMAMSDPDFIDVLTIAMDKGSAMVIHPDAIRAALRALVAYRQDPPAATKNTGSKLHCGSCGEAWSAGHAFSCRGLGNPSEPPKSSDADCAAMGRHGHSFIGGECIACHAPAPNPPATPASSPSEWAQALANLRAAHVELQRVSHRAPDFVEKLAALETAASRIIALGEPPVAEAKPVANAGEWAQAIAELRGAWDGDDACIVSTNLRKAIDGVLALGDPAPAAPAAPASELPLLRELRAWTEGYRGVGEPHSDEAKMIALAADSFMERIDALIARASAQAGGGS